MPLSLLAWVGNFYFNLLLPFLTIIRILSSQATLIQILLYKLISWFPWSALLPFPSHFKSHNLTYLGVDVSANDMTIPSQTALNYIFNLHSNTHAILKNINPHPIDQCDPTHHSDYTMLIPCNLASSTTVSSSVSQQYSKTGLTQHW